jgi:hypothetical protein
MGKIIERRVLGGVIVDSGDEGMGSYWAEDETDAGSYGRAQHRVLRVVKAGNPSLWRSRISGRPLDEALRSGERDH